MGIKTRRDYLLIAGEKIGITPERVRVTRRAHDLGPGWFAIRLAGDRLSSLCVHESNLRAISS